MPVKTTGAEFKRFYDDKTIWVGDMFHEGEVITINGVEQDEYNHPDYATLADGDQIIIAYGVVYEDSTAEKEIGSFEGLFRKWRRQQTTEVFMVEAPKEKVDAVRAAVKAAGGKALR
jgi:hypothetical protein